MNTGTVELIIYALSVILPSAIAILTLMKKTYFKKGIKILDENINALRESSTAKFQQLSASLDDCQFKIGKHNQTISKHLQEQTAAQKIREITKHAIDYCGRRQLAKIIDKFTQQSVNFVQYILEIGFENVTKEQIIAKFTVVRQLSQAYLKNSGVVNEEEYQDWIMKIQSIQNEYLQDIMHIFDDIVNNKNGRFITITQSSVQKGIRQFILFAARLDKSIEKRVYGNGGLNK